ncbi:limonene-1,2-epoxide hydrolase [Mycobacteroides abscessus subsp. abscessus]|nr:limonene-1,2-epoxide hydrolase [Mycobacteroides abscessus subsp. abscessus]
MNSDESPVPDRSPAEVLTAWLEHFNRADATAIAQLYSADAVNHQMPLEPVVGRDAIRRMHAETFESGVTACTPVNRYCDGEWAILEWSDPQGMRGCGFFHVVGGYIVAQRGYWDTAMMNRTHTG